MGMSGQQPKQPKYKSQQLTDTGMTGQQPLMNFENGVIVKIYKS